MANYHKIFTVCLQETDHLHSWEERPWNSKTYTKENRVVKKHHLYCITIMTFYSSFNIVVFDLIKQQLLCCQLHREVNLSLLNMASFGA